MNTNERNQREKQNLQSRVKTNRGQKAAIKSFDELYQFKDNDLLQEFFRSLILEEGEQQSLRYISALSVFFFFCAVSSKHIFSGVIT